MLTTAVNTEIMSFLLSMIGGLSIYQPMLISETPPIIQLSKAELSQELCPSAPTECQNLAAVYDTCKNRILIRSDLDLENDSDNSFLLHELVHAHQFKKNGDKIYSTCKDFFNTEKEAYDIQNKYLKKQGQFMRAGDFWLNHFVCDENELKDQNACPTEQ